MDKGALSDCSSRTVKDKQMLKIGKERIKKVEENDDYGVISTIPINGDPKFRCTLGRDCKLRDCKKADPGKYILLKNYKFSKCKMT